MFLEISTTHQPATDLGFLLHKNPARLHEIELAFGKAWLFYPQATAERSTAALLLGHVGELMAIAADVGHLMRDDQMMLGVDGSLNLRSYDAAALVEVIELIEPERLHHMERANTERLRHRLGAGLELISAFAVLTVGLMMLRKQIAGG